MLCCHVATVTQSTVYVVFVGWAFNNSYWLPYYCTPSLAPFSSLLLCFSVIFQMERTLSFVWKMINIPTDTNTHNLSNPTTKPNRATTAEAKKKCSNSTESIYIITIANISREKQHSTHTPTLTFACFCSESSNLIWEMA